MRVWLAAILLWALVAAPVPALADQNNSIRATLAGQATTLTIELPTQKTMGEVYPLVIGLHGEIGDGQQMAQMSGLGSLAYQEGFIGVFPDAIKGLKEYTQGTCLRKAQNPLDPLQLNCKKPLSWLRGLCCDKYLPQKQDEVEMIVALIDLMVDKYKADPSRVYLAGYMEGAGLAFRVACAHPEKIAAIAAVGGAEWYTNCRTTDRAVPTLYFHGTKDRCTPYNGRGACGNCRRRFEDNSPSYAYAEDRCTAAPDYVERWLKLGGCNAAEATRTVKGQVSCQSWTSCRGASEFSFCTLKEAGSFWPGAETLGYTECRRAGFKKKCQEISDWLGPMNRDVDAKLAVWEFFKDKSLPLSR